MRALLFIFCIIYSLSTVLSLDPNWRLVFQDEFDGNSIDTNKWNVRNQAGNYGNSELQYYSPSAISVSNGNLVITASKVPNGGLQYTSGWVDTQNKFFTTYARYEFRAQMAGGRGMWPAIWLLSQQLCWPWGAEFDIMEYRGSYPNDANGYYHYGTSCGGGHWSTGATKTHSSSLSESFHVYALEWFPDNVTWFFDGTPFHTFKRQSLQGSLPQFDPTPHYIIMNSAMGGGYAGTPDATTVYPNSFLIDYVRVYHYGATCAGNTCSNHGCCDPNKLVCICDAGWSGSSCEQWTGSFANSFVTTNIQYTPATDVKVNGWGNGFTFYSDNNVEINNGLTLTLSTNNCPSGCAGMSYSSGGWTSAVYSSYGTFTFVAKATNVVGTGLSLGAAGQSSLLEQIAFVITGASPTTVQLISWHTGYQYVHDTLNLGFDASAAYHNYTFTYNPTSIVFYIDGQLKRTASVVVPNGTLAMGVYYAAEPNWYGGPFAYSGPSAAKVSLAAWSINPAKAICSAPTQPPPTPKPTPAPPTPTPTCQPAAVGTGTGLAGDYFDGDSATSFFTNYKFSRIDPVVNFAWDAGSPSSSVSSDYFSVRWTGQVQPIYTGVYTFYSTSDDGVRLYVNNVLLIDKWVLQSPTEHSGTISLTRGTKYNIVLEYQETGGGATQILSWSSPCFTKQVIPQSQLYPCNSPKNANGRGLTGRYYSDKNLGTLVATQIDPTINFLWGASGVAALNGQSDQYSVQWSGLVQPRYSGMYTFHAVSDDGSRVSVNGQLVVDAWVDKSSSEFAGSISLTAGRNYSINFQYYENGGGAQAELYWSSVCQAKEIIPQSQLFP
jgi:beta-glucanase (GH16 family)